jgi:hypothetical protein
MGASIWRTWLRWAILPPLLTGCQGFSGDQGVPRDPLFISRTPVTAKATFAPPVALAYLEPTVPRDPQLANNTPAVADKNGRAVQGTLTGRSKEQD